MKKFEPEDFNKAAMIYYVRKKDLSTGCVTVKDFDPKKYKDCILHIAPDFVPVYVRET